MDCREARRLLDQGVTPGSAPPERAALGFHLAGCAACRRYRSNPDDQLLLTDLLAERPPDLRPARVSRAATRRPLLAGSWTRRVTMVVVGALLLIGGYFVAQVAFAVATIRQNVRSMVVPTPALATMAPLPSLVAQAPAAAVPSLPPAAPPSAAPASALPAATPPPAAVATVPVGAEPAEPPAQPTSAWPTALPPPVLTPTLTPVPLGGEASLAVATAAPAAPASAPLGFSQPPESGGAMTVLLLGLDRRPGDGSPARMDAIIIARLDPERRRIALLSLPRDLIVNIPGYGYSRINAASVYGEIYPALGGGVTSARNTVSQLLGTPIDYVAHVDFEGFIAAVDAIGGVTIDVPKEIYDNQYPTMDYKYTTVHFLPGVQQMDGATALQYARVRHSDSDFERTRRQQQVILSAVAQVRGQSVIDQLNSVVSITSALRGHLAFDIPEDRLVSLVWSFRDMTPEQIERYSLDPSQISIGVPGDLYAVTAAPGAIQSLTRQLLGQ
jgi:polyisoprenyl-teichoic acid--peptidoglycan teichoic acid transferase